MFLGCIYTSFSQKLRVNNHFTKVLHTQSTQRREKRVTNACNHDFLYHIYIPSNANLLSFIDAFFYFLIPFFTSKDTLLQANSNIQLFPRKRPQICSYDFQFNPAINSQNQLYCSPKTHANNKFMTINNMFIISSKYMNSHLVFLHSL